MTSTKGRLRQKSRPFNKNKFIAGLLCTLHGFFLLLLAVFALNIDYNFSGEESLVAMHHNLIDPIKRKHDFVNDFLFIDISNDRKVVSGKGDIGTEIISNRAALNELFKFINSQKAVHKFILCDLVFTSKQPYDEGLFAEFKAADKLILPREMSNKLGLADDETDISFADPNYKLSSGLWSTSNMLKFQYLNDRNEVSIPLSMFQQEFGLEGARNIGMLWLGNKPYFNNQTIDLRIDQGNLKAADGGIRIIPLGEINNLLKVNTEKFYGELFTGKYVVIGDFTFDLHDTYAGRLPGPIILSNLFLSLREGDNALSTVWFLYMLSCFSALSVVIFYPGKQINNLKEKMKNTLVGLLLGEFLSFLVLTNIISLLSFLFFNKHIDTVLISAYLTVIGMGNEILLRTKAKS